MTVSIINTKINKINVYPKGDLGREKNKGFPTFMMRKFARDNKF